MDASVREGYFLEQLIAIVSILPQAPGRSLPRSWVEMAAMLARLLGKSLIRVLEGELPIALMQARRLGWEQQLRSHEPLGPPLHHLSMQSGQVGYWLVA